MNTPTGQKKGKSTKHGRSFFSVGVVLFGSHGHRRASKPRPGPTCSSGTELVEVDEERGAAAGSRHHEFSDELPGSTDHLESLDAGGGSIATSVNPPESL